MPKVGLYLRLSRDDGEGCLESESISNQRMFLQQFLEKQGWTALSTYIDDGYTGTNFERPDFKRLLSDIEARRIDTVVCKDLSRLGRDQIGTLYYYQVYFPSKGVRFISASDGTDSASPGGMNKVLPFLAAANDFYPADISGKVRTALTSRKEEGLFIGAQAPLGYQKDAAQKGHLIVNPQTAPIIQALFHDYLTHGSVLGTAKRLTEQGIPTPSQWRALGPKQQRFVGLWSDTMVRRILTNPTYAGHLTQNRSQKVNYKVNKKVSIPQEKWITVQNTHEPMICQQEFDRVQEMLATHSYVSQSSGAGHLLTGLAFCADCGSPMTYVKESETRTYMVCKGHRMGGRLKTCTSHCAREDYVLAAVQTALRHLSQRLDAEAMVQGVSQNCNREQRLRQMETARRRLEGCKRVAQSLYTDKATGALRPAEFDELFQRNRDEREQLERYLEENAASLEQDLVQDDLHEAVRQILSFEHLDRGTLVALVRQVLIHERKEIAIAFRFQKPE